ncbi:hypothetical protein ACSLBF_13010 [Pseudoalteromonas sp. T1lg65]|uniref:hypothetical protein n=1 Tax=Pseudoalteromonas sp. T1lg65 TaxID=2077101 RepID=UPI003F7A21FD
MKRLFSKKQLKSIFGGNTGGEFKPELPNRKGSGDSELSESGPDESTSRQASQNGL